MTVQDRILAIGYNVLFMRGWLMEIGTPTCFRNKALEGSTPSLRTKFAWLVKKSIFNRGCEPLLFPENGIVKIYGPSVYGAMNMLSFLSLGEQGLVGGMGRL